KGGAAHAVQGGAAATGATVKSQAKSLSVGTVRKMAEKKAVVPNSVVHKTENMGKEAIKSSPTAVKNDAAKSAVDRLHNDTNSLSVKPFADEPLHSAN
ncbi:hypothetical protein A374_19035, partial [Fictibacillus macauensis ZFHKF-1]